MEDDGVPGGEERHRQDAVREHRAAEDDAVGEPERRGILQHTGSGAEVEHLDAVSRLRIEPRSDAVAAGALEALPEVGRRVPEDRPPSGSLGPSCG